MDYQDADGEVSGVVDGDVVGVSSAQDEVMEAYSQALNELTQEIPSNREDCRGDEDNFGDGDSGFDAEDENANVNIGHSADYDYNVYEEDESLGGKLDGDESYSGYSSDDLSEGGELDGDES